MQNTKDILERLRSIREEKALKQEHIARVLGVSRTTYVRKEQGAIPITTEEWVKLADAMDKELSCFFGLPGAGDKEQLLLALYRSLTSEERDDLLSGLNLIFKRVSRKEVLKPLEMLAKDRKRF